MSILLVELLWAYMRDVLLKVVEKSTPGGKANSLHKLPNLGPGSRGPSFCEDIRDTKRIGLKLRPICVRVSASWDNCHADSTWATRALSVLVVSIGRRQAELVQSGRAKVFREATHEAIGGEADGQCAACSVAAAPLCWFRNGTIAADSGEPLDGVDDSVVSAHVTRTTALLDMGTQRGIAQFGGIPTAWLCTSDSHNCFMIISLARVAVERSLMIHGVLPATLTKM